MSDAVCEPAAAGPLAQYRAMEDATLAARIDAVRERMGERLVILGHHYQQDGVIAHADITERRAKRLYSAACISWPRRPISS